MIFLIVAAILVLDQVTKLLIVKNLALSQSVPLINAVFHLSLVYNRGAAFGIFKDQTNLFVFTSVIAIILLSVALKNHLREKISSYNLALALVLAGAMGNLIDRLHFGYVVDFLDFRVWPVFNIADSAITVGAVLLGWHLLFSGKRDKVNKNPSFFQ